MFAALAHLSWFVALHPVQAFVRTAGAVLLTDTATLLTHVPGALPLTHLYQWRPASYSGLLSGAVSPMMCPL